MMMMMKMTMMMLLLLLLMGPGLQGPYLAPDKRTDRACALVCCSAVLQHARLPAARLRQQPDRRPRQQPGALGLRPRLPAGGPRHGRLQEDHTRLLRLGHTRARLPRWVCVCISLCVFVYLSVHASVFVFGWSETLHVTLKTMPTKIPTMVSS